VAAERPSLALNLGLGILTRVHSQTADDVNIAPIEASFQRGDLFKANPLGAPVVDLGLSGWLPSGGLAPLLQVRLWFDRLDALGETNTQLDWEGAVGARMDLEDVVAQPPSIPGVSLYGLGAVERSHSLLLLFADDSKQTLDVLNHPVWGARLGAGLAADLGGFQLELELSETFAPRPVHSRINVNLAFESATGTLLQVGLATDLRHGSFNVNDDEVRISDRQVALTIGPKIGF
jgi:hypothetical protein